VSGRLGGVPGNGARDTDLRNQRKTGDRERPKTPIFHVVPGVNPPGNSGVQAHGAAKRDKLARTVPRRWRDRAVGIGPFPPRGIGHGPHRTREPRSLRRGPDMACERIPTADWARNRRALGIVSVAQATTLFISETMAANLRRYNWRLGKYSGHRPARFFSHAICECAGLEKPCSPRRFR